MSLKIKLTYLFAFNKYTAIIEDLALWNCWNAAGTMLMTEKTLTTADIHSSYLKVMEYYLCHQK